MPADLAEAGRTKVETDASVILNNAFATRTIYDSQFLIDSDHPYEGGLAGTQSNLITGALSDTTLKAAITKMRSIKDNGGKLVVFQPDTLIVPPALEWLAMELTKSAQKVGTSDMTSHLSRTPQSVRIRLPDR